MSTFIIGHLVFGVLCYKTFGLTLKLERMEVQVCDKTGRVCFLNGLSAKEATTLIMKYPRYSHILKSTFSTYNRRLIKNRKLGIAPISNTKSLQLRTASKYQKSYHFPYPGNWKCKMVRGAFAACYRHFADVILIRKNAFVTGENRLTSTKKPRNLNVVTCSFSGRECCFRPPSSFHFHPATHFLFCSGLRNLESTLRFAVDSGSFYVDICRRLLHEMETLAV